MSDNNENGTELIVEVSMELPYWVNLRKGNYKFSHKNMLKERLADNGLKIDLNDDFTECILFLDNFRWKIGFDHFKEFNENEIPYIMISEDIKNNTIVSDEELENYFEPNKNNVFFQKLKTVVRRTYYIMLSFKEGIDKTEKEIIEKFAEPIKDDFLEAINEFFEIYIGYFSTKKFCNDAYLLGSSSFSYDKVEVRIELNNEDITHKIGFPMRFYDPPFYPNVFPSSEKESQFFNFLNNNRFPSFTKILKGLSNYFFLHGDIRIGVLYLDMALESCIIDFIKYYNEKNSENRIRRIKKNHTINDFLVEDLTNILNLINIIEDNQFIADIIQFHDERNLIVYRKKRRINEKNLNRLRLSVIKIIEDLKNIWNSQLS